MRLENMNMNAIIQYEHECVYRTYHSYELVYLTSMNNSQVYSFVWDTPILHVTCSVYRIYYSYKLAYMICMNESQVYAFVWDTSHSHVTWLLFMSHDSFIRDTRMARGFVKEPNDDSSTRDMTHSYTTWLIHEWHDSFNRGMTHYYVTWLMHTWQGLWQSQGN